MIYICLLLIIVGLIFRSNSRKLNRLFYSQSQLNYIFKVQHFVKWDDSLVVMYKHKYSLSWKTLTKVWYIDCFKLKPSRNHPVFFDSFYQAEEYVKSNFKSDKDVFKHENNQNEYYKKCLSHYHKNAVIKTKHIVT